MVYCNPATVCGTQTKLFVRGKSPTKDNSPSNKTITNYSVTSVAAPAVYPYADALNFIGSSSQYLTVPMPDFLQASILTIDFWFTPGSGGSGALLGQNYYGAGYNGNFNLVHATSFQMNTYDGTSNIESFTGGSFAGGTDYHVALILAANTMKLYSNGVITASGTINKKLGTGGTLFIGWDGAGSKFTGKMQNLRITPGLARWTKNFVPPRKY